MKHVHLQPPWLLRTIDAAAAGSGNRWMIQVAAWIDLLLGLISSTDVTLLDADTQIPASRFSCWSTEYILRRAPVLFDRRRRVNNCGCSSILTHNSACIVRC